MFIGLVLICFDNSNPIKPIGLFLIHAFALTIPTQTGDVALMYFKSDALIILGKIFWVVKVTRAHWFSLFLFTFYVVNSSTSSSKVYTF